jgi:hypothetical protein
MFGATQHQNKLTKVRVWSKEVLYLGFRLMEEGIKQGTDKLKAVRSAPPPSNVHEVFRTL